MLSDYNPNRPEDDEPEENPKKESLIMRIWKNATSMGKSHDQKDEESPEDGMEETSEESTVEKNVMTPEEVAELELKLANIMTQKGNYLEALRRNRPIQDIERTAEALYSSFVLDRSVPNSEQKAFFTELQWVAKGMVELVERENNAKKAALEAAEANAQNSQNSVAVKAPVFEKPNPVGASCYIKLSHDGMAVWMFLFPPLYGGAPLKEEDLTREIKKAGVTFGFNEETIHRLAADEIYLKLAVVASGIPPIDGQDGLVEEIFPRSRTVEIVEQENNTVNYKDLNWLQQIHAGGLICNIIKPTPGIHGMRVNGGEVRARDGRAAIVPKGKNTSINTEGTALVADIDGEVSFAENKFKVEPVLFIKGDVDNATGNLDFIGDIIVNGDVRTGFTLKATGHITIKGMAEGSWVISGGNIQVGMGMNGSGRGVLDATGTVRSKYLENCTVNAGGSVYSDSIVNSTVYCNDRIYASSGYGVIIGGSVTAANGIECRTVGNQSNRPTVLVLGSTPSLLKEKTELEDNLAKLDEELEEVLKSISYLQTSQLAPAQQKMMGDLKLKVPIMRLKKSKLERRLNELSSTSADISTCHIRCGTLYPPTQINIGSSVLMVQRTEKNCNVYYSAGEIHIGVR